MKVVRRNLFSVNGGPGSMLAAKFGNEEAGGRSGKGFCRLAAALAPPNSETPNVNGGLGTVPKPSPHDAGAVHVDAISSSKNQVLRRKWLPREADAGFWMHLNGMIQQGRIPTWKSRGGAAGKVVGQNKSRGGRAGKATDWGAT
jgi:hypothetical protein